MDDDTAKDIGWQFMLKAATQRPSCRQRSVRRHCGRSDTVCRLRFI